MCADMQESGTSGEKCPKFAQRGWKLRRHLRCPRKQSYPDEEEVDTVWREGLPLTAPARTLIDVAGEIQPEQLEMAMRQALGRGLLTARELEKEARRRGRYGAVGAAMEAVTS
jgi:hypothetical protein